VLVDAMNLTHAHINEGGALRSSIGIFILICIMLNGWTCSCNPSVPHDPLCTITLHVAWWAAATHVAAHMMRWPGDDGRLRVPRPRVNFSHLAFSW